MHGDWHFKHEPVVILIKLFDLHYETHILFSRYNSNVVLHEVHIDVKFSHVRQFKLHEMQLLVVKLEIYWPFDGQVYKQYSLSRKLFRLQYVHFDPVS